MKNKKKISRTSKVVIAVQLIIVVIAFGLVLMFWPRTDYPRNGAVIHGRVVDFEIKNADFIIIDDNPDFTSPSRIDLTDDKNKIRVMLEPGTYYWKIIGIFEGGIQKFVIPSEVGLKLNDSILENTGNVPVNVSKQSDSGISGLIIIDVSMEHPVDEKEKTIYRGEEYER